MLTITSTVGKDRTNMEALHFLQATESGQHRVLLGVICDSLSQSCALHNETTMLNTLYSLLVYICMRQDFEMTYSTPISSPWLPKQP